MKTNEEIADSLRKTILHTLNWLDEQNWPEPMNRKKFVLDTLERVSEDTFEQN
jgi:hypothetical protein